MTKTTIIFEGLSIQISNLDKKLWPGEEITKADLLHYFARIGPVMVPHLENRPLTVVRCPDGIEAHSFYQKDAPAHTPSWIKTHRVNSLDRERSIDYIVANDVQTLLWLANQGAIEYHPWMSRTDKPRNPTYAVIDLDPSEGAGFDAAREVARVAKRLLDLIGLVGVPKTSGATGIHIMIPLAPVYTYEVTSRFVGLFGRLMERELPELITTQRLVRNRPFGTVYVDHLQNLKGKTVVAPYSPRPHPGAPVSAPFEWVDLDHVTPEQFHVRVADRLLDQAEHYARVMTIEQSLDGIINQLRRR